MNRLHWALVIRHPVHGGPILDVAGPDLSQEIRKARTDLLAALECCEVPLVVLVSLGPSPSVPGGLKRRLVVVPSTRGEALIRLDEIGSYWSARWSALVAAEKEARERQARRKKVAAALAARRSRR